MQLTFDTSTILLSCLGTFLTAVGGISFWAFRNYVAGVADAIKSLEKRMAETETTVAVTKAGFAHMDQRLSLQDAALARIEQRLDHRP